MTTTKTAPAETTTKTAPHDLASVYRHYAQTAETLAETARQLAQRADLSGLTPYAETQPVVLADCAELRAELVQALAEPVQHQHLQHLHSTPVHLAKQLEHVDLSRPDKVQYTVRLLNDTADRLAQLAEYAVTTAAGVR